MSRGDPCQRGRFRIDVTLMLYVRFVSQFVWNLISSAYRNAKIELEITKRFCVDVVYLCWESPGSASNFEYLFRKEFKVLPQCRNN